MIYTLFIYLFIYLTICRTPISCVPNQIRYSSMVFGHRLEPLDIVVLQGLLYQVYN